MEEKNMVWTLFCKLNVCLNYKNKLSKANKSWVNSTKKRNYIIGWTLSSHAWMTSFATENQKFINICGNTNTAMVSQNALTLAVVNTLVQNSWISAIEAVIKNTNSSNTLLDLFLKFSFFLLVVFLC